MQRGEAYGWGCFVKKMQRGFTLIEILAVVTILAIAALAAIPMVNNGYADVKLTAAARSVMADLFYAQNYAITNQTAVYILITPSTPSIGGAYTLQYNPGTITSLTRPGGGTFKVNLGAVTGTVTGTQLVDAKLGQVTVNKGTLLAGNYTIGFDTLGEPFTQAPATPTTDVTAIPLLSRDGTITTTLNIEAFTGEITVQ